jgi:hypothetical protein
MIALNLLCVTLSGSVDPFRSNRQACSAATNQENRRSLLAVKKEKKEKKETKEKKEKKDDGVNQGSSAANQGDDVGENNQAASGARTLSCSSRIISL